MTIELTPLDVRTKGGDFTRRFRGYDREEVDSFMAIVADRLEALIRELRGLQEERGKMEARLNALAEREQAIKDAVVTAQVLRKEVIDAVKRKAEVMEREAELRAERIERSARDQAREIRRESDRAKDLAQASVDELYRHRDRLLQGVRGLLDQIRELIDGEERRLPEPGPESEKDEDSGRFASPPEGRFRHAPSADAVEG